ncbi:MAG: D-cysteine desulfhydrase family protein [Armatimonadetes bacterium]|nr:D-cysteine desulfhydrase family protein [Armatimonadota bacterium]
MAMFSHFPLMLRPTPCHRLDRASELLGIDLWIKRDDLSGFALGGNKARKLEFLIQAALESGADTVVTCGASQSNFVRQLSAGCAMAKLKCVAAVMDQPYEPGHELPQVAFTGRGNLVLDDLFGADIRRFPNGSWDDLYLHAHLLAENLRGQGANVYEIPVGGSSALGAYAFFLAADELPNVDTVVTASSSGSTHAGLQVAFRDFPTRVIGIACDPEPELIDDISRVANELCELLHQPPVGKEEFDLRTQFVGPGYGIPSDAGNEALRWLARTEGIVLDPVYSAKAFSGLMELARQGEFDGQTVVFWHTGGTPAIFAYF